MMNLLRLMMERLKEAPPAVVAETTAARVPPTLDFQKTLGRDQVTGLPNRPCFAHLTETQSSLASQLEVQLSVLVVAWEGYLAYGREPERDRQLIRVAGQLRNGVHRSHDVLGSLGHGQFGVLLPFTDVAGADRVARNLLEAAQVLAADSGAAPVGNGTTAAAPDKAGLTIGMACYCGKGKLAEDALLQTAEQAMAFAQMNGGNRMVRFDVSAGGLH
jgi:diguanylate cyclase (GGDEF)-like protein